MEKLTCFNKLEEEILRLSLPCWRLSFTPPWQVVLWSCLATSPFITFLGLQESWGAGKGCDSERAASWTYRSLLGTGSVKQFLPKAETDFWWITFSRAVFQSHQPHRLCQNNALSWNLCWARAQALATTPHHLPISQKQVSEKAPHKPTEEKTHSPCYCP